MPIAFKSHLERWARLFEGTRDEFESDARSFHESWREAAVESAEIHRNLFERKVASLKEAEATAAAERARLRARDRELVDRFKRKVFDE